MLLSEIFILLAVSILPLINPYFDFTGHILKFWLFIKQKFDTGFNKKEYFEYQNESFKITANIKKSSKEDLLKLFKFLQEHHKRK